MKHLARSFFRRDPVAVARALLGQRLVRVVDGRRLAGLIVETAAYLGVPDKAAHTCGGRRTPRNESMWRDGGVAYVYFTYGMHHCFNVVVGGSGQPVAVLIRAIQPMEGLAIMARRRRCDGGQSPTPQIARLPSSVGPSTNHGRLVIAHATLMRLPPDRLLCSGPARLCQALAIDRSLDGVDMVESKNLFIEQVRCRALPAASIVATPRIGVAYAGEWAARLLRFYVKGSPYVSCQ